MIAQWTTARFPALGHRQFRLLFLGTTFAQLAFGMFQVVQGVVAFDLTGKNSSVGFVSLGMGISMVILGPVGGTLSDRVSKRLILTLTQATIGVLFFAVAMLIVTDLISIWALAASSLILGTSFAFMGPTRQAYLGDLLDGPLMANGIALNQVTMNGTRIVGPLVAGAMIAVSAIGTGGTYLVMSFFFLCVVLMMFQMDPTTPRPRNAPTSMFADLKEGATYLWFTRELRLLTLVFVGVVLSGFSYQTVMPGFLTNELGQDTSRLGILFGAAATGGIVTTIILAGRGNSPPRSGMMFAFGIVLAVSLVLLAVTPNFALALVVSVLMGASSSGFQLLNNVNLMERTRPEYFGRVMAVTMMAFGVNSIVAFPVGALADAIGERPTIAVLGCCCAAVVSAGFFASRLIGLKPGQVQAPGPANG